VTMTVQMLSACMADNDCADSGGLSALSGGTVTSTLAADVSAADYLERLKVLRVRCGLDSVNTRTDSSSSDIAVGVTKPHTQTVHDVDGSISVVRVSLSHQLN